VSGPAQGDSATLGIEYRVGHADEHVFLDIREKLRIDLAKSPGWRELASRLGAKDASTHRHDQRGRDAFAGDIRDGYAAVGWVDREVIVVIAAHLSRRDIDSRDLIAGDIWRAVRQENSLDLVGNSEVFIEPFFFRGFVKHRGGVQRESGLLGDGAEDSKGTGEEGLAPRSSSDKKSAELLPCKNQRGYHHRGVFPLRQARIVSLHEGGVAALPRLADDPFTRRNRVPAEKRTEEVLRF
jgi:hypothetical protein